jgi:DNA-binding Lrp family transcriptional regulator
MKPLYVQIKCELGQAYRVAERLIDTVEETSEIYSISGAYDLLAKFWLDDGTPFGEFVNSKVHAVPGIRDTFSLVAFRLFSAPHDGSAENNDETDFRTRLK